MSTADSAATDDRGRAREDEGEVLTDRSASAAETEEPSAAPTVTLTYLGRQREVPLDEAVTLAQKGLNYDHVCQERDRLRDAPENTVLDYFAQKGGMSREEYLQVLWQQMQTDRQQRGEVGDLADIADRQQADREE